MILAANSEIKSLFERLRREAKHASIKKCSERGCTLKIDRKMRCLILKGEMLCASSMKISDCLIFCIIGDCLIVCIAELKQKTIHAKDVLIKLQNSSEQALELIKRCEGGNAKCDFYHLVLARGWHPSEYNVLTRNNIKIKGKRYSILPKRCGANLASILRYQEG
ncbi:MAG: hypothetical protein ABSF52_11265 [Syntrophobacteraceae bacterium]|jgi:hypothetical protein